MDQDELADKYDAVLNGEKVEDEEQRTYTYIGARTNTRHARKLKCFGFLIMSLLF